MTSYLHAPSPHRERRVGGRVPEQHSLLRAEEELDRAPRRTQQTRLQDNGAPGHEAEVGLSDQEENSELLTIVNLVD